MKVFFNWITTLAVRFRWVTLSLAILMMILGGVAITRLNQELLPPIDLPQTIILAQASGMTSEEVLTVLTARLETELDEIDQIINIESQTTGAFGAFITAFNDFGINQDNLREEIDAAIESVWLPERSIQPAEGEDPQAFAQSLLADMPPEPLIYLSEQDSNFFFQLSPEVWNALPDETVEASLAYLAGQVEQTTAGATALERLVDKELVPQLNTIDAVANVEIDGGQSLPGEEDTFDVEGVDVEEAEEQSLLLRLSTEVWEVVAPRVDGVDTLDESAVETLSAVEVTIPEEPPILPESWQQDHFINASDLLEVQTLTTPIGQLFNNFYNNGIIRGALGQTNDLTPETINRMLEIEPSLVQYFEAEQLVAMPPEVFDTLPEDFIANLDGFTRDALAAAALAQSITGEEAEREPVDLPSQWQIQTPQLITFSFADIPLATFSVASTGAPVAEEGDQTEETGETTPETDPAAVQGETEEQQQPATDDELPEGPALAPIFALVSAGFEGVELNTADDLVQVRLPDELAETAGIESLSAAEFLNFLVNPPEVPEDADADAAAIPANFDPGVLINSLSPEAVSFIIENDPTFLPSLDPAVFENFSAAVLELPEVSPPLADAWNELANQPQFDNNAFETAQDVIDAGDGQASTVLNLINENIPAQFEGYEVRLFNSLTPGVIDYFLQQEPDFYENVSSDVLLKFNPEVLAELPEEMLAALDSDVSEQVTAIAQGEQSSAFAAQQELYTTDLPPADPDAPELNPGWGFLEPAYGIELDTADDFFRFPDDYLYEDAAALINSIFESPQGANFAPELLGNLPIEALQYMVDRDAAALSGLNAEALRLLTDEALALLPEDLQERAESGRAVFEPETQVTRTNGQPSLFLTVFKDAEANTVTTFADVEELMQEVDAANDDIAVGVVFEQSSFIEDSISGVAREGSLGAVFAIIIILVFLSTGQWDLSGRRRVGLIMVMVFILALIGLVALGLDAAGGDWGEAFAQADVVLRVLLIFGIVAGFGVLLWPGDLPDPAWRATIVIAVSIPLSILTAFAGMHWVSPFMYDLLLPLSEAGGVIGGFFSFVVRLFPEQLTLNIMTLSGLTVAVGRVVDDSIVVLENIFRQIESGDDKREAVLSGARDVSAAIFTATLIAVVVFLPLGLTGGIIGAFFLPFGLAVTYALIGSFTVAVTVVPALAYIVIDEDDIPEEGDIWLVQYYRPVLKAALSRKFASRWIVVAFAIFSMVFGFFLLGQRPAAFLPNFGEPQVTINVEMPSGTSIIETNERVRELENYIDQEIPEEQIIAIQTTVGGGGANFDALLGGGGVTENVANIIIGLDVSADELDARTQTIREEAEQILGPDNVVVSAESIADGGFGGLAIIASGPPEVLAEYDAQIREAIGSVEGITNVTSNLSETDAEGPPTIIRVNQQSAISYGGELETENTIGVTQEALVAVQEIPDLPESITVSQGFESEIQTEGFNSLPIAMGLATLIVIAILIFSFQSLAYWLAIIFSIIVAPVGAAIALTLTERVLGISALIGLLMLLGLVVTNAVVLIDRVRSNLGERDMKLYDALVEAGGRRLRPILMTSLATIIALTPLAIGLSDGAIIASELGTVVIGGVFSSTLLTLIVVPVAYSLLTPVHRALSGLVGRKQEDQPAATSTQETQAQGSGLD